MVGWHHRFYGHELGQTPGDSEEQGGLVCFSPWGGRVGHDLVIEQQLGYDVSTRQALQTGLENRFPACPRYP